MYSKLHAQKKSSQNSDCVSVSPQVQSRPFEVQAKAEVKSPQSQETPELQTQSEHKKRSGHNLADISLFAPNGGSQQPLQKKLTIGQPGDKYEQEADLVAAQVVSKIAPESASIQRQEIPKVKKQIQRKDLLQRQPLVESGTATPSLETSINSGRSGGQSLPNQLRRKMETAMGADLNGVKIHNDAHADTLNRSLHSRAFTTGQHIFFKKGEYNPGSKKGQELIAHETTHYLQQNRVAVQRKLEGQENPEISFNQAPGVKLQPQDDSKSIQISGGIPDNRISLKKEVKRLDFIKLKRKEISVKRVIRDKLKGKHDQNDFGVSGHYWTEIGILNQQQWTPTQSYGWWPNQNQMQGGKLTTAKSVLGGVEGILNDGKERDPHHNQEGSTNIHPTMEIDDNEDYQTFSNRLKDEIRVFAHNFKGSWNWRFGWGKNCHTFQDRLMKHVGLHQGNQKAPFLRDPKYVGEQNTNKAIFYKIAPEYTQEGVFLLANPGKETKENKIASIKAYFKLEMISEPHKGYVKVKYLDKQEEKQGYVKMKYLERKI